MCRFTLKEELCGVTSRQDLTFADDDLKLTYLPSPTKNTNGFLMKIEGKMR